MLETPIEKKERKKTEVRYKTRRGEQVVHRLPLPAFINRSRDRAGSTNERVVAPARGIVGRLPREAAGGSEGETDG